MKKLLLLLITSGGLMSCSSQIEPNTTNSSSDNEQQAGNTVNNTPVRYCLDDSQIIKTRQNGQSEAAAERVLEDFFGNDTVINRMESAPTFCLRLKRNSLGGYDSFFRVELEDKKESLATDSSLVDLVHYRKPLHAFHKSIFRNDAGERVVNVLLYDGQGLVELYASGHDDNALAGTIRYYNYGSFVQALDDFEAGVLRDSADWTVAEKLGYNFRPGFFDEQMNKTPEEIWWTVFTDLLDSNEAVTLGEITVDLNKVLLD